MTLQQHILAIVTNSPMNIGVSIYIFFQLVFLFSLGKYPEAEFLDAMVVLCLIF